MSRYPKDYEQKRVEAGYPPHRPGKFQRRRFKVEDRIFIKYFGPCCGGLKPQATICYLADDLACWSSDIFRILIRTRRRAALHALHDLVNRPCDCGTHGA